MIRLEQILVLYKLVDSGVNNIDTFVQKKLSDTNDDLEKFPFQSILKALKNFPYPDDGVSPNYFKNLQEKGVELFNERAVGTATKDPRIKNVILSHGHQKVSFIINCS